MPNATDLAGADIGAALRRGADETNAALVTATAGGATVDVIVSNVEPEGRASGGVVDLLVIFWAQVDGQAVNAQTAQFVLDAAIGAAAAVNFAQADIEKVLAGTINHDVVQIAAIIPRVPRGTRAANLGATVRARLTAVGQDQDVPAGRSGLVILELSDSLPAI